MKVDLVPSEYIHTLLARVHETCGNVGVDVITPWPIPALGPDEVWRVVANAVKPDTPCCP
jgi:hypothetical protein